ncbi:hypothetical protein ABPG72_010450 [Tetrahymena utriculariae]
MLCFHFEQFLVNLCQQIRYRQKKMMNKLWGDNFFDPSDKKQRVDNMNDKGQPLKRAFVQFIMDPICKLDNNCMDNDVELMNTILVGLELTLSQGDKELKGQGLFKSIMSNWLNAAGIILEMVVIHLPSPKKAQIYRISYLYERHQNDEVAKAMRNCDPKSLLMIYVSKMVPTADKGRFFAFGKVFSGTISTSQKIRILGPNYYGTKYDLCKTTIQKTLLMQGRATQYISSFPYSNFVGLVGIDQFILKNCTITDHPDAHTIRSMKQYISSVTTVAINVKNAGDLPKLIEGLKKLSQFDHLVICTSEESTGQHIITGRGELHIEICLKDLEKDYANCPIIKSDHVVTYKETVTDESRIDCMSKSANKGLRIYAKGVPLEVGLSEDIENGTLNPEIDQNERSEFLCQNYGWDRLDAGCKL